MFKAKQKNPLEVAVYSGQAGIVTQRGAALIAPNMLCYRLALSAFHKQRLTDHALNQ